MAAQNEPLDPDWIATQEFDTSFRGFDQAEVRSYLRQLAKAVRADQQQSSRSTSESADLSDRVDELEESEVRLKLHAEELEKQLADASNEIEALRKTPATVAPEDLDSGQLTQLLGEETVRVLDSARSAAADIKSKAETEAAERTAALDALQSETTTQLAATRKAADEELATMRADADAASKASVEAAETEAARVTTEAAEASDKLRSEAAAAAKKSTEDATSAAAASKSAANDVAAAVKKRGEDVAKETRLKAEADAQAARVAAEQTTSDAEAEASRMRAEAAADVETARDSAREEARLMLSEAQTLREKVLEDLVRRRRTARQQIDQAKAARDRLASALVTARSQIDHATAELDVSIPEAKKAMNLTGTRSSGNEEQQMADLAHGLDEARSAGKTLSPEKVSKAGDMKNPDRKPAGRASRSQGAASVAKTAGSSGQSAAPSPETSGAAAKPAVVEVAAQPEVAEPEVAVQDEIVDVSVGAESDLVVDLSDDGLEAADGDDLTNIFARLRSGGTESEAPAPAEADQHLPSAPEPVKVVATPTPPPTPSPKAPSSKAPSAKKPSKPSSKDAAPSKNRGATAAELAGQATVEVDDGGAPNGSAAPTSAPAAAPASNSDEPVEILPAFGDRDIATTRFGPDLRRKLKRALADDQSDVLDRLRRAKDLSHADLPDASEQIAGFRKAAEQGLVSIASAGSDSIGGKSVDPSVLTDVIAQLAKDIHAPLRAKIERAVSASDGDTDGVLEPVRAHYRDARSSGLPALVDDAIAAAFAIGTYSAIANKAKIKWVNDPRSATSPDCFDNTLETSVVKPKPFPTGHTLPLGGPGCRCLVLPA